MNITTIFLGVSVGATTTATAFLNYQTLAILVIGILAFALGSAGGVLLAKFMNLFTKNKINPLIGSAGVSAVPMAARVSQTVGQEVKSDTNESPVYNQIIVPKGKRTHIYFADGTHIYVNSGTKVTYPAVFSKEKREIYVDGEVYLEVKRDVNRPFYVKAEGMSVQVLGTSFGVCAYKEDKESSVVLVSGKVEVETNAKQKVTLAPDELFSMKNSEISTRKVDASEYVCWTQGLMIFNKEPLDKVFNRLSRYYGQDIRYKGSAGEPYYVSGKLDLRDSLEEVLRLVTGFAPVAFDKTENVITVELIK